MSQEGNMLSASEAQVAILHTCNQKGSSYSTLSFSFPLLKTQEDRRQNARLFYLLSPMLNMFKKSWLIYSVNVQLTAIFLMAKTDTRTTKKALK